MGPAGLLLIGRGGREGGVRWTPVRARAYRKRLILMRVVVGLLVSRRRVGALSDSTGVVEVRGCTGLEPSSQLAFVSEDGNARLFIDAMQSVACVLPLLQKSDSIGCWMPLPSG